MDVPACAKDMKRFIKTGEALRQQHPYAAVWCWMHALEQLVPQVKQNKTLQPVVIQLMDSVEQLKTSHKGQPSMSDKDAGRESIALLAAKIFQQADREDHEGATMGTAMKFRTASTLFDICRALNPDIDEFSEQRKYAKVKMVAIQRAIKKGETPVSGPVDLQGNPISVSSEPDWQAVGGQIDPHDLDHSSSQKPDTSTDPWEDISSLPEVPDYSSQAGQSKQPDSQSGSAQPSIEVDDNDLHNVQGNDSSAFAHNLFPDPPKEPPAQPAFHSSKQEHLIPGSLINHPDRPPFRRPTPAPSRSQSSSSYTSIEDVPTSFPGIPPFRGKELTHKQEQLITTACKRIASAMEFHDAEAAYNYLVRAMYVIQCDE